MSFNLFVILSIFVFVEAINYCDKSLCPPGIKHIACKMPGAFGPHCPKDAELVTFDTKLKDLILEEHNDVRNLIAVGSFIQRRAACRMATMQWDDELAHLASLNVMQCKSYHDECHNTFSFKHSGQHIYEDFYYFRPNYKRLLKAAVGKWYQVTTKYSTYLQIYTPGYNDNATIILADQNTRVGCAAVHYGSGAISSTFLLTCNYATYNTLKRPIYEECKTAGAHCSTGHNPSLPYLCSVREIYDLNKSD